jgi:hypothetical protein
LSKASDVVVVSFDPYVEHQPVVPQELVLPPDFFRALEKETG